MSMNANAFVALSGNDVYGPPVGFRRAIPIPVKFEAVISRGGCCTACGGKLGAWTDTEFDHVPALALRLWDPDANDTVPGCNDPAHIEAKHKDCHASKTTGRKGESKLSRVGGDTSEVAKLRRTTKKQEAFRLKLLAKDTPDDIDDASASTLRAKPSAWGKRPFSSGAPKAPRVSRHHPVIQH